MASIRIVNYPRKIDAATCQDVKAVEGEEEKRRRGRRPEGGE
jgi:hypothetical protein